MFRSSSRRRPATQSSHFSRRLIQHHNTPHQSLTAIQHSTHEGLTSTVDAVANVCPLFERCNNIQELTRTPQGLLRFTSRRTISRTISIHNIVGTYSYPNRHSSIMSSDEDTNKGERKRPSRLLNLNNSPRAQKLLYVSRCPVARWDRRGLLTTCDSGATNAATSSLLLLPPEIRCRIYDYAFSGFVFHISSAGLRRNRDHHNTLCQSPHECELLQFKDCVERVSDHPSDREVFATCSQVTGPNRPRRDIPLHMLQSCRQVYHEAVLKPFAHATFHFVTSSSSHQYLHAFLNLLVPAQAKAIAHFFAICAYGSFISPALLKKFEGLNRFDLHLVTGGQFGTGLLWGSSEELEAFARLPAVQLLKKLDLKSLRFTTDHPDSDKATVLEWIRLQEIEILSKQQPMLTAD